MKEIPESVIAVELGAGERLLWAGVPRRGLLLRASDAMLIPFSLMWGGFAIFWETGVISSNAPLFFWIWGIPFVLVGLYIMVGRFFVDARLRSRTYYGLTNQRALIVSGLGARRVTSLNLETLSEVSFTERGDRSGTVHFGPPTPAWQPSWPGGRSPAPPMFELIPEARSVFEHVRAAQRSASGPSTS